MPEYKSFLLRMWRVREADHEVWRASLESIESGEKRGFASLEALLAYLSELAGKPQEECDEGEKRVQDKG